MPLRPLLLAAAVVVLLGPRAWAQPSAEAVLAAWAADWQRAWGERAEVVLDERAEATVEGPRRTLRLDTEGTVALAPGRRPERRVRRTRIDGQPAERERGPHGRDRIRRAFGRAGREVLAPANVPTWLLGAEPLGIAEDRADGEPAWRIDLRSDHYEALAVWVTRSETAPRLLAARAEGRRAEDGRLVRAITYRRRGGLDLPAASETTYTGRQRRRLREYVVTLRAVGTYAPAGN